MTPEISIIIPTYAPGKWLWECLESLDRQTMDKQKYEVLLILNGKKRPYLEQIQEHAKEYGMHLRLEYTEDKGVSHARNLGIDAAKGAYITFIDDDDLVSEKYLELLLENASQDGVTEANVKAFRGSKDHETDHYLATAYKKYDNQQSRNIFRHRSMLSTACCKLIPRRLIGNIRFLTYLTHGEDSYFMFKVSAHIREIRITPEAAIYYIRKREHSASRSKENKWQKKKMELRLFACYAQEYLAHPRRYRLEFFVSRLVATAYKLLLEDYVKPL